MFSIVFSREFQFFLTLQWRSFIVLLQLMQIRIQNPDPRGSLWRDGPGWGQGYPGNPGSDHKTQSWAGNWCNDITNATNVYNGALLMENELYFLLILMVQLSPRPRTAKTGRKPGVRRLTSLTSHHITDTPWQAPARGGREEKGKNIMNNILLIKPCVLIKSFCLK